jgi:hypothetical protein
MVRSVRADALFCLVAWGGENDVPPDNTGPVGQSPFTGGVSGAEAITLAAGPCVKEEVVIL